MGYSNNKWKKILYILMIINLCFILFAKFNKVFGADISTFDVDTSEGTFTFPNWIKNYNYAILCSNYNNIPFCYFIILDDNVSECQLLNTPNDYVIINRPATRYGIASGSYSCVISEEQAFSSYKWNIGNNNSCNIPKHLIDNNLYYYSNFDFVNYNDNTTILPNNNIKYPEIANTQQQLETLDFDVLSINAWSYSNEDFDVLLYDLNYGSDTTDSLYPVNVITLNKDTLYYNSTLTADPDKNAIYWIPIEELGFNWVKGNKYGIKFAVRDYGIQGGGGFRGEDYIYQYIGEETVFTVSNTVPDSAITALNNSTQNNIQNNQHEEIVNNMNNITNNLDNVNDALTNTTPDNSVSSDIDSALNFNNQNAGLNNLNNGFFSRLTSMLSNLLGYNLGEDSSVSIPLPHSNKSIVLHSNIIYDNVTGGLRLIINAFWLYIFSFYMWRFINKIYIAISTGNILDTFSSSGEAITNDML